MPTSTEEVDLEMFLIEPEKQKLVQNQVYSNILQQVKSGLVQITYEIIHQTSWNVTTVLQSVPLCAVIRIAFGGNYFLGTLHSIICITVLLEFVGNNLSTASNSKKLSRQRESSLKIEGTLNWILPPDNLMTAKELETCCTSCWCWVLQAILCHQSGLRSTGITCRWLLAISSFFQLSPKHELISH